MCLQTEGSIVYRNIGRKWFNGEWFIVFISWTYQIFLQSLVDRYFGNIIYYTDMT